MNRLAILAALLVAMSGCGPMEEPTTVEVGPKPGADLKAGVRTMVDNALVQAGKLTEETSLNAIRSARSQLGELEQTIKDHKLPADYIAQKSKELDLERERLSALAKAAQLREELEKKVTGLPEAKAKVDAGVADLRKRLEAARAAYKAFSEKPTP